jgi:hypothetical protein
MATQKQTKAAKYETLISRTQSEIDASELSTKVEIAQNALQQGILSVKSDVLAAQSKTKSQETKLATAKKNLEAAKSYSPLDAQSLVAAFTSIKQAQADLDTAKEEQVNLEEVLSFLQETEQELF